MTYQPQRQSALARRRQEQRAHNIKAAEALTKKGRTEMSKFIPITISILESFESKDSGATILCVKSNYTASDQRNNKALTIIGDKAFVCAEYLANVNNWDNLLTNYHINLKDLN